MIPDEKNKKPAEPTPEPTRQLPPKEPPAGDPPPKPPHVMDPDRRSGAV